MSITKEKILALVCTLVAVIVLANVSVPSVKDVDAVPPEEKPSAYRFGSGAVKPRLAPEQGFTGGRDPFQAKDPWAESAPALLAVPPARAWPRAFPGGVAEIPKGAADRLMVEVEPKGSGK